MQDEEGYMTLNLQLKKRSSSVMLHWYKILLGISGTINGILVLTLISLSLLVSQGVLQKCQKGHNLNLTQHDDIGNPKMNNGTRGNISNHTTVVQKLQTIQVSSKALAYLDLIVLAFEV
uniref:Killer cell lectin like receptor F1 n=1 Tax=Suricata suricatta TaxID=37032 RepID=A0A673T7H4_SURSU